MLSQSLRSSYAAYLLLALWNAYRQSNLKQHIFLPFERFVARKWHSSVTEGVILSEGLLSRSWGDSLTCRVLGFAVNLPAAALHWVYRALRRPFEESVMANLVFDMGEEAPIAVAWMFPALLFIPFDYWSNVYSFLAFAAALALFYIGGMRNAALRLDVKAVGPYLAFFALAVVLSVPLSHYPSLSARFLLYHAACMICVMVVVSSVRTRAQLKRLAMGASLAVLGMGLYGIYQRMVVGVEVNLSYVDLTYNADMPGRVYSVFDNPNAFGEVLVLLLPLAAALVVCARRWWGKLTALAVFCVGGIGLAMTYSRAGWVGLAAAMVLFVLMWNAKLVPLFALLGVAAVPFLPETVFHRILTITNFSDTSTSSRFPLYTATVAGLKKSPILGAGLGTDAVRQFIKINELYHAKAPYVHAHNTYLQVWIETGLLGILSFAGGLLWTLKASVRAIRRKASHETRLITIGGASALAGSMVCGLADYLWNYPRVMCVFWFVVAVTLAGIRLCGWEGQEETPAK